MLDAFGREINYLRLSVTSRCNLRCLYCVAPGASVPGTTDLGCQQEMTPSEMESLLLAMGRLGIRKVRITGGEPLVRTDLEEIIHRISRVPEIEEIGMTTNGIGLAERIASLEKVGLKRVNISLDSLDAKNYAAITGGGELNAVLKGFQTALDAGLLSVRLNVVVMQGVNDHEVDDFIQLTRDNYVDVRFIELMPIGGFGEDHTQHLHLNTQIMAAHPELRPISNDDGSQPAVYYAVAGHKGRIGLISPMSHKFCSQCNRIRVTADGKIKPCLGENTEFDLLSVLRSEPEKLQGLLRGIILRKPSGHHFDDGFESNRTMAAIGG